VQCATAVPRYSGFQACISIVLLTSCCFCVLFRATADSVFMLCLRFCFGSLQIDVLLRPFPFEDTPNAATCAQALLPAAACFHDARV
jgi:hypothetical protein